MDNVNLPLSLSVFTVFLYHSPSFHSYCPVVLLSPWKMLFTAYCPRLPAINESRRLCESSVCASCCICERSRVLKSRISLYPPFKMMCLSSYSPACLFGNGRQSRNVPSHLSLLELGFGAVLLHSASRYCCCGVEAIWTSVLLTVVPCQNSMSLCLRLNISPAP